MNYLASSEIKSGMHVWQNNFQDTGWIDIKIHSQLHTAVFSFNEHCKNTIFKMQKKCKPFLICWCSGIRSSAFKIFPTLSVMWRLFYFVPCDGHQAHFLCGQMRHLRCLPSLHWDHALARSNCQSGCLLVAFGSLCSHCGFCGCFHQAVWSLSEAQACRPAFLNQCQPSYLGHEAKYHIYKTAVLCLST